MFHLYYGALKYCSVIHSEAQVDILDYNIPRANDSKSNRSGLLVV